MFGKDKEKIIKVDAFGDTAVNSGEPEINPYYATVSYRYKFAKYVAIVLLIVFVLLSIMLNRENITYSNFVFLVKDMNTVFESDGILTVQKNIMYNTDASQCFTLYRRGLAVAGGSNIYLFNSSGKQTLSMQMHYSSPHFSSSEKYLLVYDLGGNGYSLYNSFAKIHSEELDYPVSGAAVCDSGAYAIISKDREYNSSVLVYNKNFELTEKNRKNKYVADVSLDKNGEELLIASFESENGEYYTEISASKVGSGKEYFTVKKSGLFPVSIEHNESGGFFIVYDNAIGFFDEEKKEIKQYDFHSMTLSRMDITGKTAAVLLLDDSAEKKNKLIVFDVSGDTIYEEDISGKINSICSADGYSYLLFDAEIRKISHESGTAKSIPIGAGAKDLILQNENAALLCFASYTQYIELN